MPHHHPLWGVGWGVAEHRSEIEVRQMSGFKADIGTILTVTCPNGSMIHFQVRDGVCWPVSAQPAHPASPIGLDQDDLYEAMKTAVAEAQRRNLVP